mmetsp:Transcript_23147/g.41808  ORF Transcript_23147/g.41808 Transcript_23147/m.41808 type:complete len:413 (-) Transcript_23147:297-1535(-)
MAVARRNWTRPAHRRDGCLPWVTRSLIFLSGLALGMRLMTPREVSMMEMSPLLSMLELSSNHVEDKHTMIQNKVIPPGAPKGRNDPKNGRRGQGGGQQKGRDGNAKGQADGREPIIIKGMPHFAVMGFAKCGTTTMMKYLNEADGVFVPQQEMCFSAKGPFVQKIGGLIAKEYQANQTQPYLVGFKCPSQILRSPRVVQYLPDTRIIVGLRHPVLRFESFYNFRVNNGMNPPRAEKLIGTCCMTCVCTERFNFHYFLHDLGKTSRSREEQQLFLGRNETTSASKYIGAPIPNKIFLFDVEQLSDDDERRSSKFREDLQHFISIRKPLHPIIHETPGKKWPSTEKQMEVDAKKIDICQPLYDDIRAELLRVGGVASKWILQYFIQSDDIFVSSRPYFEEALKKWTIDPCLSRK